MKRKIVTLSIFGVAILVCLFLIINYQPKTTFSGKIKISTSFYPYYFFASQIGGEKVGVVNITPAGREPHDYEPTSQDIVNIESSKLLILNGIVEPWVETIESGLENKNVVILKFGKKKNSTDPHTWLSPTLAKKQVSEILSKYLQIDPQNNVYYSKNASQLSNLLDNLDKKFAAGLLDCKQRNIVTSHNAFGYLVTDYNLKQIPISGLNPDEEPSLKQLAQISKFAKENDVEYIFFERLVKSKISETIAREIGARTLVLNPLEGLTSDEISQGKNYFTEMEENLKNLRVALDCK